MVKIKDEEITRISKDALYCIEGVAAKAEEGLRHYKRAGAATLTTPHTFNQYEAVNRVSAISESERLILKTLLEQPVIARVEYTDDYGNTKTIFVTRGAPIPVPGFTFASYNAPIGQIAAIPAGQTYSPRDFTIESSAKLRPRKDQDGWDAPDTELDIDGIGKFTVISLRAVISPQMAAPDEDPFAALDDGEKERLVAIGIRRAVLSHIALRDQPILDRYQDEIFRLPINTSCFLSGPPGTGKTTTLIRRLGQKTAVDDPDALDEGEQALIRRAEEEFRGVPHRDSWIMFSPTELLRQYVKEAFAREGFAATDHHTRTWSDYRREIARDYLRLLRTGTGSGPFIEVRNDEHLDLKTTTIDPAGWYDDFDRYRDVAVYGDINADIEWLSDSEDAALVTLGRKLKALLGDAAPTLRSSFSPQVAGLQDDIKALIDQRRTEISKIVNRTVSRVLKNDQQFLSALKQELEHQAAQAEEPQEDADDDADLEDEEAEAPATRAISREKARSRYERAVIALARARSRRRAVPLKSRQRRLLDWLGQDRVPERDDLETLARISEEQRRLRRFANLDRLLIRSISTLYKKFRAERAADGVWYSGAPARSADISWRELDLVILATLRMAEQIFAGYRRFPAAAVPEGGVLDNVRSLYRNQVLVDEATDFSVLQLACMHELAHPAMKSFFVCGDVNQRLTDWGVRSNEQLDWVHPQIERRSITVSYRQSAKLVALATDLALLGGSSAQDIDLPDRAENEGVSPVWVTGLSSDDLIADWLALRIQDIERMVGTVPTIAVLVNEEADVEPLATALDARLEDVSLSAVPCKDGKVVGNDRDVRVFNIEHIKGLEFEAVFFVGLDKTISKYPDLYTKYLYVGATRAATYLAITFGAEVSEQVRALGEHFRDSWPA